MYNTLNQSTVFLLAISFVASSEAIMGWKPVNASLWTVILPNRFFGDFNPYNDRIHGDYMHRNDNNQHTGIIYLDEIPRSEAASKDELDSSM